MAEDQRSCLAPRRHLLAFFSYWCFVTLCLILASGVAALEWYAEEAKRTYGQFVPTLQVTNRRQLIHHQPVGLVGIITPWNFPLSMITRKAGAALAAGCAVILKPAEDAPLSALAITHLAASHAKLPLGLLNTITASRDPDGAQAIGELLCEDPAVRLVGFTGSTAVGKLLYRQAAAHGKRVLLELGGNAPFIVFASANLDLAVKGMIASKFRCSGQTCVSANRILVEDCVYDEFVQRAVAAVRQLRMGDGLQPDTRIGPLINKAAVSKWCSGGSHQISPVEHVYSNPTTTTCHRCLLYGSPWIEIVYLYMQGKKNEKEKAPRLGVILNRTTTKLDVDGGVGISEHRKPVRHFHHMGCACPTTVYRTASYLH
ncbi:unnamed protein product [Echinostoma caproni]|uniref:Aldehyde dehydrogenase domain-containing protein n=1 Tax=Echinostoma caproni TaxID=27848 RepID=A0A3P8I1U0_9TREM|nr:unnamed protein product [Echinostoma caproni]